jgi:hypothetical protein
MKLVSIEECEVTIALDVDELDLIAEGLRRAGADVDTREGARCYYWRAVALMLSAASIPARMAGDVPERAHPARYMESLRRRMARLSGEEPPAA